MFQGFFSKRNRALLAELVRTDFKLRYQGSALGYAWSLLRPLMLFGILYVIFARILKSGGDIPHFPVYLLLGLVLWQFFSDMTQQSLTSIVGRGDLIRKIRIPRWIIVFSSSLSAVINLILNLTVVVIFMVWNQVGLMPSVLLLPLIIIEIYIFALGISLFLAAAFVKFRDISYVWEVILQAGFYITPILYSLSFIPSEFFQKVLLLNPMAQAIQDARYALVTHSDQLLTTARAFDGGWYVLLPFVIVVLVFIGGLMYFKKQASSFAENV